MSIAEVRHHIAIAAPPCSASFLAFALLASHRILGRRRRARLALARPSIGCRLTVLRRTLHTHYPPSYIGRTRANPVPLQGAAPKTAEYRDLTFFFFGSGLTQPRRTTPAPILPRLTRSVRFLLPCPGQSISLRAQCTTSSSDTRSSHSPSAIRRRPLALLYYTPHSRFTASENFSASKRNKSFSWPNRNKKRHFESSYPLF